jgi:hypothetical protein
VTVPRRIPAASSGAPPSATWSYYSPRSPAPDSVFARRAWVVASALVPDASPPGGHLGAGVDGALTLSRTYVRCAFPRTARRHACSRGVIVSVPTFPGDRGCRRDGSVGVAAGVAALLVRRPRRDRTGTPVSPADRADDLVSSRSDNPPVRPPAPEIITWSLRSAEMRPGTSVAVIARSLIPPTAPVDSRSYDGRAVAIAGARQVTADTRPRAVAAGEVTDALALVGRRASGVEEGWERLPLREVIRSAGGHGQAGPCGSRTAPPSIIASAGSPARRISGAVGPPRVRSVGWPIRTCCDAARGVGLRLGCAAHRVAPAQTAGLFHHPPSAVLAGWPGTRYERARRCGKGVRR